MRALLLALLLLLPGAAAAKVGAGAPCPDPLAPPFAPVGASPNLFVWRQLGPGGSTAPVLCQAWGAWRATRSAALAGRFRDSASASDLLARLGAISALAGLKYWSITDHRWATLITDAGALEGLRRKLRRADFTAGELRAGEDLYFAQQDNRSSSEVIYRMRVRESSEDRLVVSVENATPVRRFLLTLFDPGDLQAIYILRRFSPQVWGCYVLSGVREGLLTGGNTGSQVNRAAAIYRHIAGIPGDQDPPAWP